MKRLSLLIFFCIICSFFLQAQNDSTKQLKVNSKFSGATVHNLVNSRISEPCLEKKFSIVFFLINDSLQSLPNNPAAMATYSLPTLMNILNTAFAPICVSFEHCRTVIIPHWPYNRWRASVVGNQVISTYYHENTINVYLPIELIPNLPDDPERSYTYEPATSPDVTRDAIVVERDMASLYNNVPNFRGATLLHAFGHYFGLKHTSDEIDPTNVPTPGPVAPVTTYEYVDRSNCKTHGDGFCDTDADPWPNPWIGPTGSVDCAGANAKDGKGKYYIPPFDNIMSLYTCRCRFSPEQYKFMAEYMMKERKYLH